ncbi:unnamed protein product [Miscanthus lutarioriparius]|uniref:Uncharacterized protein n=1 Tax=Miscanthus lutarioriparius TaxID=422564 RepID=A0A811QBY8_9POAL|nr:unnamed protein product [Miscanthus lutarioriparius]
MASTALNIPSPSSTYAGGSLDTSHDEEIARKLFVGLIREAISILGDSGLVILSSDSEEESIEEEADEEEKKEELKDEPVGSGSSMGGEADPISPPCP